MNINKFTFWIDQIQHNRRKFRDFFHPVQTLADDIVVYFFTSLFVKFQKIFTSKTDTL